MAELVTLVIKKQRVHRIKVPRDDLTSKSKYFASLLSQNFKDSQCLEHHINYDVEIDTLRTFVKWILDPKESVVGDRRRVKPSLAKYTRKSADFEDLLQLLQMSVLFASEPLINDLTDLIACHYLIPQLSVRIWLFSRALGLVTLKDLAKAACIDRFLDLPLSSIQNLSGIDFIELAGSAHIKAEIAILVNLAQKWIRHNLLPGETNAFDSHYPFTLIGKNNIVTSDFKNMYGNKQLGYNIQCIVGQKQTADNEVKKCIYCWDGATFSEVIELSSSPIVSVDNIVGMKVLGRGFDIYIIGGEYGRRSGNFQTEIWRYSLISKTWYYVTSIPRARSRMAVIFVEEDLYLIGGIEQCNLRRSLVDVYNVHTGKWKKLRHIPELFADKALICNKNGSVMLHDYTEVYQYHRDQNRWFSRHGYFGDSGNSGTEWRLVYPLFLMPHRDLMYVLGSHSMNGESRKIFWVEDFESLFESSPIGDCMTVFDNQVGNWPFLIGFSHVYGTTSVEVMKICGNFTLETAIVYQENRSDIRDFCPQEPIGCFNVINPKSLNELFLSEDNAK